MTVACCLWRQCEAKTSHRLTYRADTNERQELCEIDQENRRDNDGY